MNKKRLTCLTGLAAAVALFAGCAPDDEEPIVLTPGEPAVTDRDVRRDVEGINNELNRDIERARGETREAIDNAKEYSYTQRSEFVAEMREELADLNQQIDRLSARAATATGEAKEQAERKLEELRKDARDINRELDRMMESNESTWDDMKAGFRESMREFRESVRDLGDRWDNRVTR